MGKWLIPLGLVTGSNKIVITSKNGFLNCVIRVTTGKGRKIISYQHFIMNLHQNPKTLLWTETRYFNLLKIYMRCVIIIENVSCHWVGWWMTSSLTYSWMTNIQKIKYKNNLFSKIEDSNVIFHKGSIQYYMWKLATHDLV